METIERIKLRDELFEKLKNEKIIFAYRGCHTYFSYNKFINGIKRLSLYDKYKLYIQQFRSEDEAIWCLLRQDDFENHKCPICKNICKFYNKQHGYRQICGNKICKNKLMKIISSKPETKNKVINTNKIRYGSPYSFQNTDVINKGKETKKRKYGDENYHNVNKMKQTYAQNHKPKNLIIENDIIEIIDSISNIFCKSKVNFIDIFYNDDYFIVFIKILYNKKNNESLKISEIMDIFKKSNVTITKKIKKLNLLKYFNIQDSNLELQFKELLENNNIIFERHNKNILLKTKNNGSPELDFYLKDYNITFEINDINSHNITSKKDRNKNYHLNKTLQCKEKGIRLIHLWEWELTDENLWRHTSNWILNLLNNQKININVKDCAIKEINIEEAQNFLNEYNLYQYIESDIKLGLYYQDELLQMITFKRQENDDYKLLQFCTKFNYKINFGAKKLLNFFIKQYNPSQITTTINLDKFTGKTFEETGFKLIKYVEPKLISYNNENNSLYKSIYNCGQSIYILEVKNGK